MRSSSAKVDKKAAKSTRPYAIKKKLVELKQPIRDTISETISFVIKGKLTPIKPILIDEKFDLLGKTGRNKTQNPGRINKKRKVKDEAVRKQKGDKQQPARNAKQKAKAKSKVQTDTAKKASAQSSTKKLPEAKPPVRTKYKKVKKPEESPVVPKSNAKKAPKKSKKKLEVVPEPKKPQEKPPEIDKSSEIKKQQTIEELLKQVNEEIRETKKSSKLKKQKTKLKKDAAIEAKKSKESDNTKKLTETKEAPPPPSATQSSPKKSNVNVVELEPPATIKTEVTDPSPNDIPDELPLNKLTEILQPVIKKEPISDKEEQPEVKPLRKSYKRIKTTPKMTIMKKRVMTKRYDEDDKDKKYKTKLFGFWNGPKRHRVASLNALAKVHCLYENESRANILDTIEDGTKLEYTPKKETSKKSNEIKKEMESSDESMSSTSSSPIPTRTLRTGPGLRGAGKHWDMHSSFSSSEDVSDVDELPVRSVKKEKPPRAVKTEKAEKTKSERKRARKQSELVMDLKDMVVRKRMASLNASAILAASYSVERRHQSKSIKSDDSDSYDGSSEEYFAASDTEIKQEDDVKKEEDRKLIEVHATPNKKVAVILNQDTDVTITGVYVNSTTRSTHHEGFCSIAGMQYRISATSHTQTAATAVSTETLLQSSSGSAPESNSDSMPSSKSYTPLDALSNMQPPPGPGIQHNHPVVHGQQHLGPPHQHVLPIPPHQLSPGLRHSCSSAFSSPHSTPTYQIPHHPPLQGEQGFVHAGYYQPAGPLITVPTGHGQPPPTSLSTKSVPLSETSPSSTTPSVTSHDPPTQVPPSNSNGGDSSDSDVIITSVTTAKDHHHSAPAPPAHHQPTYRYSQYPPTPPGYSYTHYPPYPYSTPPPTPSYAHHELCYSYKYPPPTSYRRYLTGGYYPTTAAVQELYPPPAGGGQGQQTQQVVSAAPPVSAPGSVASFPPSAGGPPPPTLIETYPAPPPPPQATLIETYPPPSTHYYPPQAAYGPAPPPPPSCYTHPQQRAIPFINATYQSCPCPMQSCPKNVHTGPLTGDGKRSNMTSISKDSMPLPPVALALPLEPVSATGPPSPARGSAGMPPPPSPAGATYHQPPPSAPPPPTTTAKQEPIREECKKRKARVGKAMVRSSIQQNTMLLMCNPTQSIVDTVKREIESPKEKEEEEECDEKKEILRASFEEVKPIPKEIQPVGVFTKTEVVTKEPDILSGEATRESTLVEAEEKGLPPPPPTEEILPPVVSTVAENVKMKNMKRKLSSSATVEKTPDAEPTTPKKKPKLSSYKCLIKKNTTTIKINNGKRKLIEETLARNRRAANKSKRSTVKRKLSVDQKPGKRPKLMKPLGDSNSKQGSKSKTRFAKATKKPTKKQQRLNSKSSKTVLDTLISKNNMERTIDSVVRENRISKESALKAMSKCGKSDKDATTTTAVVVNKKSTNNKNGQNKVNKSECKKAVASSRRKSKTVDVVVEAVTQIPRKTSHLPKWSNGWRWEGEPYEGKVFINSDEMTVVRKCYPAMLHETGDKIVLRDCVLLKAGPRKNDLPYVAKIAALWENPEDGEMMMSLLWYYRPEHTEQGRLPTDQTDEVFASRHKDSNSVACIDDKCYVLTFNEYCRYRKRYKRIEEGIEETLPCIPNPEPYPRSLRQPPTSQVSPEMVFFCRRVYDFRQKRIMKNPT